MVELPGLIEVRIFIKQAQSSNPMSRVQQNVIKHKVGLLNLVAEFGNVSRACKVMGFPVRACAIFASDLPSWPK